MKRSYFGIMEYRLILPPFLVIMSIILTIFFLVLINNTRPENNFETIIIIFLTVILLFFSWATMYLEMTRFRIEDEIRRKVDRISLIEKSLENFYRPLQNLFIDYEDNPMGCYQNNKAEFFKIGCYRHLSEKRTFRCFEIFTRCMSTDTNLKKLLSQASEDIKLLQKEYEYLRNEYQ